MGTQIFVVEAEAERIECAALASGPLSDARNWAIFFSAMHSPTETLEDEYTGATPRGLVCEGYAVVTFSPPGHGQFGEREDGEYRNGLQVFREQLVSRQDVVQQHFQRTQAVRDYLEGLTERRLEGVVAGGISRGAYAALISAAALGAAAEIALLYAPVTRLTALSEFRGFDGADLVAHNQVLRWVERLPVLSVYANIGCDDERVGTGDCLALFRALHRTAKLREDSVLKIFPIDGHSTQPEPERTSEALTWLRERQPRPSAHENRLFCPSTAAISCASAVPDPGWKEGLRE